MTKGGRRRKRKFRRQNRDDGTTATRTSGGTVVTFPPQAAPGSGPGEIGRITSTLPESPTDEASPASPAPPAPPERPTGRAAGGSTHAPADRGTAPIDPTQLLDPSELAGSPPGERAGFLVAPVSRPPVDAAPVADADPWLLIDPDDIGGPDRTPPADGAADARSGSDPETTSAPASEPGDADQADEAKRLADLEYLFAARTMDIGPLDLENRSAPIPSVAPAEPSADAEPMADARVVPSTDDPDAADLEPVDRFAGQAEQIPETDADADDGLPAAAGPTLGARALPVPTIDEQASGTPVADQPVTEDDAGEEADAGDNPTDKVRADDSTIDEGVTDEGAVIGTGTDEELDRLLADLSAATEAPAPPAEPSPPPPSSRVDVTVPSAQVVDHAATLGPDDTDDDQAPDESEPRLAATAESDSQPDLPSGGGSPATSVEQPASTMEAEDPAGLEAETRLAPRPDPAAAPDHIAAPEPPATPESPATPEPPVAPDHAATPQPSATPDPAPAPGPTPKPLAAPERSHTPAPRFSPGGPVRRRPVVAPRVQPARPGGHLFDGGRRPQEELASEQAAMSRAEVFASETSMMPAKTRRGDELPEVEPHDVGHSWFNLSGELPLLNIQDLQTMDGQSGRLRWFLIRLALVLVVLAVAVGGLYVALSAAAF
ncbi:MAG: hypothetical protein AAGA65_15000 [Actinomycetota bacterium]